jgi:hypothetical protein
MLNVPPRLQKLPLASGTVHIDTPKDFEAAVISNICNICLVPCHSLACPWPARHDAQLNHRPGGA